MNYISKSTALKGEVRLLLSPDREKRRGSGCCCEELYNKITPLNVWQNNCESVISFPLCYYHSPTLYMVSKDTRAHQ